MSSLVVGGVVIPVAPGGISRDQLDGADRARAFDQTYRASVTGNPKRDWSFSTPPISRADVDNIYEPILSKVVGQTCYGDIIGGGANQALWSEDLTNAVWVVSNATRTPSIAAPDGSTTAVTITATAANGLIEQNVGNSTSVQRTNSFWIRRRTGTGVINLETADGNVSAQAVTSTWTRFSANAGVSVNRFIGVQVVTSGDAVDIWHAQMEEGTVSSAWVRTTTVAVNNLIPTCCSEITGWTPVRIGTGHYVVLSFSLHEV